MRDEYDSSKAEREAVIQSPGKTRITIMLGDECWVTMSSSTSAPKQSLKVSATVEEMRAKTAVYLACGAGEVWIVATDWALSFFDLKGERSASAILVTFATRIGAP